MYHLDITIKSQKLPKISQKYHKWHSKAGGQTSTVVWSLTSAGIGITTAMHIGSEPVVGSSFAEILLLFEADEETKAVVLFGEIGTVAEEEASEVIKEGRFTKPLVAYIAGRTLPAGMRFSPPGQCQRHLFNYQHDSGNKKERGIPIGCYRAQAGGGGNDASIKRCEDVHR